MKQILNLLPFLLALFISLQGPAQTEMPENMTLGQVEQAMQAYPPCFEHGEQRLKIMESLDKIINFSVSDCGFANQPEYAGHLKEIVKFYRNSVDKGLDALENTNVNEGVHVFKFYSSSVVLKSSEGVVAIDFAQGPVGNDYKQGSVSNEGEPETSDFFNTGFYFTREQRDRLARIVDVYIITHPHQDHADYSLAMRLIKADKPVIGPEQLKLKWEDLSSGIIVPDFETMQKFGPCEIFTQSGKQYSEAKTAADGIKYAVPTRYLSRDVESIRYLVKLGGITFLQGAETHTEGYEWLEKASSLGWSVDVLLTAGAHQGYRSVMKFLHGKQVNYFSLPIHEYEITHPGGGQRLASRLKGDNRKAFDQKKLMPLMWGENFLLTHQLIQP
ncbi:MAG: hypothetical protein RBS73_12890 [Prolixibacteraceae bacterium]|jgi:L-ascorbate metabolism protein UlaG (beta-lactamase superfamily)|nr:hypothetical protein [Prolixibacteraceae bacterium]